MDVPNSMLQMPVPQPTSSTRGASLVNGAQWSLLSKVRRQMVCWRSACPGVRYADVGLLPNVMRATEAEKGPRTETIVFGLFLCGLLALGNQRFQGMGRNLRTSSLGARYAEAGVC